MEGRPTWTDCDEAGDYVVPNVLRTRDLVCRPDNMDETVPHTHVKNKGVNQICCYRAAEQCLWYGSINSTIRLLDKSYISGFSFLLRLYCSVDKRPNC